MEDVHSAGKLFDPVAHISAAVLYPVGIEHKGGLNGIKSLYEHIHCGSAVCETTEFMAVVVVGELEAVFVDDVREPVCVLNELFHFFNTARAKSADTHVGGTERTMLRHSKLRIAQHFAHIVVGAADLNAFLTGDLSKFRKGNRTPRSLTDVVPKLLHFPEAHTDIFRIVHGIADGKKL